MGGSLIPLVILTSLRTGISGIISPSPPPYERTSTSRVFPSTPALPIRRLSLVRHATAEWLPLPWPSLAWQRASRLRLRHPIIYPAIHGISSLRNSCFKTFFPSPLLFPLTSDLRQRHNDTNDILTRQTILVARHRPLNLSNLIPPLLPTLRHNGWR